MPLGLDSKDLLRGTDFRDEEFRGWSPKANSELELLSKLLEDGKYRPGMMIQFREVSIYYN